LDFGVQFDKLTVRAVTEPVEVQSNDFGFWIFPTDESGGLKFRKNLFFPRINSGACNQSSPWSKVRAKELKLLAQFEEAPEKLGVLLGKTQTSPFP